ncbi:hypothetical protein Y88_0088 [Novosphingobium nitrogenifigens DSM 19370]|uniref:EamA domain-containing protein n=1 Tax=Novosphingobium nitrogenifigens DSM 19370 TaxID=983920 RepID=F1ZBH7_9SPHN|nr:DMT family transporter [Novosphingobium nitrogenifigens]EGD58036.1 hypothetical protein Y88_0088 [Novosphingobium nitrogenifigens DSM 19370]
MSERKPIDRTAATVMVILCLIWGTQQVAIKWAAPAMSATLQMGLRSGLAALGTLAVAFHRREQRWLNRATLVPGLLVGSTFGLEFVFAGEALRYTTASHVTIYLYSAPIMAAVGLGLRYRDERLHPAQWIGVIIAFAGVALAFLGRGDPDRYPAMRLGDALSLAAAASWAVSSFILRGSRLANAPASVSLFYQLCGAFVLAGGMAVTLGETAIKPTAWLAVMLTWQTLVVAFASYLTWFALLRRYSASRLGVLSFMTPVFGVVAGIALLGEKIDTNFAIGGCMILGGIVLASTRLPRLGRRATA